MPDTGPREKRDGISGEAQGPGRVPGHQAGVEDLRGLQAVPKGSADT